MTDRQQNLNRFHEITPVILAGGKGTRLRSVVSDRPKALAQVNGRPFLSVLLDQLLAFGFQRVVLCVGYRSDQIIDTFGSTYQSLDIIYSRETVPLGTGGAILSALPMIATSYFLIHNGDSFIPYDLNAFTSYLKRKKAEGGLIASYRENGSSCGQIIFNPDQRITGFMEKSSQAAGWVNAGIYLIPRNWFAGYIAGKPYSMEFDFLPGWTTRKFYAFRSRNPFIDIGTPESYRSCEQYFSSPILRGCV
ncbi:MAG: galactokinase [Candidatus Neomarinimicrobiota bacterium]|nr:MAG: galactokinase [Candidatus Neomarinimicrobiota bacterium]